MTCRLPNLSPVRWLLGLLAVAAVTGCDEGPASPEYDNPYDAEAPGGPTLLDAPPAPSLEQAAPTTATLAWEDRSHVEEGYVVERAVVSATTSASDVRFTLLARLPANATRFTDTTATGIDAYHYRLRSVRGALQSPASPVLRIVWPGLTLKGYSAQIGCLSGLSVAVCTSYSVPYRLSYPDGLRQGWLGGEAGRLSLNASRTRLLVASSRYNYPSNKEAYTVYDLATGQQVAQYITPELRFEFGNLNPFGFFVGEDEVLLHTGQDEARPYILWQPSTGQQRPAPPFGPLSLAASATGTVFTYFDNTVVAFDAFTGERRWTAPAQFFHLSPAGRYAFLVGAGEIAVVNSSTGARLSTIPRHVTFENPLPVQEEGFFAGAAEDQPVLALSSSNGSLYLKDWQSVRTIRILPGSNYPLRWNVTAFLPSGNLLLTRNYDQYAQLDLNAVWTTAPL